MNKMYPNRLYTRFLVNAFMILLFSQVIGCKCGANKGGDGEEAKEEKPNKVAKITLTGPDEVKGGHLIIDLEIEVTGNVLDMKQYTLEAIDLQSFDTSNYDVSKALTQTQKNRWTKVSDSHGKTLEELTGTPILKEDDKVTLSIPVIPVNTTYTNGPRVGQPVPFAESAEFQFGILDSKGDRVAGPIDVKWTTAT